MSDVFRQRRFGVRTSFSFGDTTMVYGLGDWNSLRTQKIPYEILDLQSRSEFSVGNTGYVLRWAWLMLFPAASLQWFRDATWFGPLLIGVLVVAAAMTLTLSLELTEVRFTEIATFGSDHEGVRRFLRIIRDAHHDLILEQLESRWHNRMRTLYGQVDFHAAPDAEAARLGWLHEQGIIDQAELEHALTRIMAAAAALSTNATDRKLH